MSETHKTSARIMKRIISDLGRFPIRTLADNCGVSIQAVSMWFHRGKIPVERIPDVERTLLAAGSAITRHEINPAIFGPNPDLQAKTKAAK